MGGGKRGGNKACQGSHGGKVLDFSPKAKSQGKKGKVAEYENIAKKCLGVKKDHCSPGSQDTGGHVRGWKCGKKKVHGLAAPTRSHWGGRCIQCGPLAENPNSPEKWEREKGGWGGKNEASSITRGGY